MSKHTVLAIIIFGALLAWLTLEYVDHYKAYQEQNLLEAEVIRKSCRGTGGSKISVSNKEDEKTFEVTRQTCNNIIVGDIVVVLKSSTTGKFYWNKKPTGRIFWLYPIVLLIIAYMIYWNRKKGNKES